jgi:hypothetical protein
MDTTLEKQVIVLNESPINFFKGTSLGVGNLSSRISNSTMCQICNSNDHIKPPCAHILKT